MFCYCSVMVEHKTFDTIEVNFLVAGHTHSTIDQYFSVFSHSIGKSSFIGTPLALEWLLKHAHKDVNLRPHYWRLEVKSF